MQISNNYLSSKSINNPNFKAIRNIKCEGFFENNSVCADALLEAFAKNEKAKNFIGKYDVDIVLNSFEKTKDFLKIHPILKYYFLRFFFVFAFIRMKKCASSRSVFVF